jgi:hypothetical protein
LTPTQLKFEPVVRDRLFYDRFQYCLSFDLPEISCLRNHVFDPEIISKQLGNRRQWRDAYRQGLGARNPRTWRLITPKTEQDLLGLAQQLNSAQDSFKLVVSVDHGRVYSNSQCLLDQLSQLPQLINCAWSKAVIDRPRNSIKLKQPGHQLRSYFKFSVVGADQQTALIAFLKNQQGQVRLSPALTQWLEYPQHAIREYFFVDHDHMSWLTMLCLVLPGVIRKTVQIVPAK